MRAPRARRANQAVSASVASAQAAVTSRATRRLGPVRWNARATLWQKRGGLSRNGSPPSSMTAQFPERYMARASSTSRGSS